MYDLTKHLDLNHVAALIPARSGSKGIKDKNVSELNGYPLFAYSIAAAKLAGISHVFVSTDDWDYKKIAESYGGLVPELRPKNFALDNSADDEFFKHALDCFDPDGKFEFWVHLRPTTPLRDPSVILDAITSITSDCRATSLRSGHLASESPLKWFLVDDDGYFVPLMEGLSVEAINKPRQKFQDVVIPNGYVDIVKRSCFFHSGSLHGDRMMVFKTKNTVEIDSYSDFAYCEYQSKAQSDPLGAYLQGFKNVLCRRI